MTASSPYEIIAAPLSVYQAPVGEPFPAIEDAPAGNWSLIGTSGILNITEDGITIEHPDEKEMFYSVGGTGPSKVFRVREGFIARFALADMSLEQYRHVLNDGTVTDTPAGSGAAGFRDVDLYRGADVANVALLLRGTYSPYGTGWNSQFQIPRAFQSGVPSPVFVKGIPAGLAFEYTALEDPNAATSADRFGKILVQDENVV